MKSAGRLFACAYFPFKEQLSWLQTRSCWLQTPHHSTSFATRSTRLAISSLALWTSPYVRLSFGSLPFDLLCMPDFLLWSLFFTILKVFHIVRKNGTEHNQMGKTWRKGGIHLYSATWTTCYVSHAHIVQILKRTWFYVKEKIFAKNYSTQLINIILKGLYLAQGPSQRLKLGMFKFNLAVVWEVRVLSAGHTCSSLKRRTQERLKLGSLGRVDLRSADPSLSKTGALALHYRFKIAQTYLSKKIF